jgi:galactose mutarotase-like enzyme
VIEQQNQWVSLSSGALRVAVDPLGAQLSILRDRSGRDLLWNGDASVWTGRSPLLFPIVGALVGGTYRLGSDLYHLPRHGFARGKRFAIVSLTNTSAVFRLRPDEATLQVYPFRFELNVHFELDGATLSVEALVCNAGDEAMPASFGYHPAFRWPLPYGRERGSHVIEFPLDEPSPVRRLDGAGLLSPVPQPTPVSLRRLALADSLFTQDVIIFDELASRSVTYGVLGEPRLRVTFPDAPYLGLWTKPGAEFLCIEPWHGIADPAGFAGDFLEKPGVFIVAPGACLATRMTITVLDG